MNCCAIGRLLFGAFLVATVRLLEGSPNLFEMTKGVEVRCSVEKITVIIHLEESSAVLEQGRLRLNRNYTECQSKFNRLAASLELEIHLHNCELTVATEEYSTTYSAMVDYLMQGELIDTLPVTCVHPNPINRTISASIQSKFYKNNNRSALLQSNSGEAFEVVVGSQLRFETVASIPWHSEHDFYTYPVTCWTSDFADQRSKAKKLAFLQNGCPAVGENHRGLSRIVHDLTKAGSTAVDFALISELLPSIREEEDGIFPKLFVHCDIIVCSGLTTTGFLSIPKCPKSSFCVGESAVSHRLPAHLVDYDKLHIVKGPISPVSRPSLPPTIDRSAADDCIVRCRTAQLSQSHTAQSSQRIDTVLVQGIPTTTAALIAFFSFLCGAILTATLWIIHVKTDPRRNLKSLNRPETRPSDQAESTLISNSL